MNLELVRLFFELDLNCPSGIRWQKQLPIHKYESYRSYQRAMSIFAGKPCGSKKQHISRHVYWNTKLIGSAILCHRIIYMMFNQCDIPNGYDVDHIDGDTLNNHPENLRLATRSQNCMNAKGKNTSKTGLKGVSVITRNKKVTYESVIMANGKGKYLGSFPTAELAHDKYIDASHKMHGEYGRSN